MNARKTDVRHFSEEGLRELLSYYWGRFVGGFNRQDESDRGLAARLKEVGLEKPLRGKSFDNYPGGLDLAWDLQRFSCLIPTNSYRAFGSYPEFVIHDLGVKIARLIPFRVYIRELQSNQPQ